MMKELFVLIRRNCKLFFKDKGIFFTSLITPLILLVLYSTFLGNVYRDGFSSSVSEGMEIEERLIGGLVGGELVSSLLAVSAVTVAFCSNMLMVQDKVSGARRDLRMTPVKKSVMALGYYISSVISTLIVCFAAAGLCFLYLAKVGWYLTAADLLLILFDVFLLVLFGTALSSIVNVFLSSQGQISAVGTLVSSGYGFICGAYMPISNFGTGLQRVVSFLPGTYGTSLLRNHAMRGAFGGMAEAGIPSDILEAVKDSVDCNLYFFDHRVKTPEMYGIVAVTVVLLIGGYVLLNIFRKKEI